MTEPVTKEQVIATLANPDRIAKALSYNGHVSFLLALIAELELQVSSQSVDRERFERLMKLENALMVAGFGWGPAQAGAL